MNVWQGDFPTENTGDDGYIHTAPVDAFGPQNDYGMYNMLGNVWEWTSDTFTPPQQQQQQELEQQQRVLRGASYLDSRDGKFNHRTRVTTRMGNTEDSSSDNLGFRCVRSGKKQKKKDPRPDL